MVVEATASLSSNQYSLIIYRDSLWPGAGQLGPWHGWPLPGGPQPGRPAVIPTRGTWLCSSHSSTLESLLCLLAVGEGPPAKPSGA